MELNRRNKEICAGLAVYGLCLVANCVTYRNIYTKLQLAATMVLIFGVLKAHPLHKHKSLLIWLCITSYSCISMVQAGFDYSGPPTFIVIIFSCSLAAATAYMWGMMYDHYVTLTLDAAPTGSKAEVQEQPPPYNSEKVADPKEQLSHEENLTIMF